MLRVLGIESSCDDTSVGIVELAKNTAHLRVNVTASQVLLHRKYGGVVPEVAAREHALTILPTIQAAMKKARTTWKAIDAIAVTAGPGLQTALRVGVEAARTLSWLHKKPIVRVNHIEGHVVSSLVGIDMRKIRFPAVALIISGGHTELILIPKIGQYKHIGRTIDDAVGEAFDKTAKVLGLDYPGGPEVSRRARLGNAQRFSFPRAMMKPGDSSFSYSGLKTSVRYEAEKHRLTKILINDLCASFEVAAIDPLIHKTKAALDRTGAKTLLLGGGVAASLTVRQRLQEMIATYQRPVSFFLPDLSLCTDNGAMIALAGSIQATHKRFTPWDKIEADPNWELV